MQAGGRLVEEVEGAAGRSAPQLLCRLEALGLAAGDGGGGLAQREIAEAHVRESLQPGRDLPYAPEDGQRLVHRRGQHLRDVVPVVAHREDLAPEPAAPAARTDALDCACHLHLAAPDI
ncbi:hypothetical protein [Streptomyces europaeiscabiei]|uniref:hypothetical protein n=1 Tax=Streptomyces europaeiscabiei TaxID=146819 RepID=UPI0038D4A601